MKVSELSDAALDWAVSEAVKPDITHPDWFRIATFGPLFGKSYKYPCWGSQKYSPSTDWKEAGWIIERERIGPRWDKLWNQWGVPHPKNAALGILGQTFLIAAMRCFVASKLGDEIEIPKELT
jgi:hypothetical protein